MPDTQPALSPLIFRAYDIRGIVGQDLTPAIAERIGRAYATYVRREYGVDRIVTGRDNRPSSATLWKSLVRGVRRSGISVTDIGLSPSPLLYFAAAALEFGGGIVVTASHSPPEWNGFKVLGTAGLPLAPEEIQAIRMLAEGEVFEEGAGAFDRGEVIPQYVRLLAERFALPRPLRLVVDPGNGVAALTGPRTLREAGATVQGINVELNGRFPARGPDPHTPAALAALGQAMRDTGADMGIAWDADGDRLALVDEQGTPQSADAVLALLARDLLSRRPGAPILVDVRASQATLEDIRAHGGAPLFGPSGHSLMKRRMHAEGILLGGEASSHFYFGEDYYGLDDAVYAACALARIFATDARAVSAHFADVPRYVTSPEMRLACAETQKFLVVREVAAHFRGQFPLLEIDGARIDFGDGWALVRASNTGPAISVRFEAKTAMRALAIQKMIRDVLGRCSAIDLPSPWRPDC